MFARRLQRDAPETPGFARRAFQRVHHVTLVPKHCSVVLPEQVRQQADIGDIGPDNRNGLRQTDVHVRPDVELHAEATPRLDLATTQTSR